MKPSARRPKIALVVPSLAEGGGVPSVARFVKDVVLRSSRFDLKLISLSTSSRDPANLNLGSPATWSRGAIARTGEWEGLPYVHVGAECGELEFQRYRPRNVLRDALVDCDLTQVVAGSPAWANAVTGLGKPVLLQVATRARVERRMRDSVLRGPSDLWRKAMTEITDKLDDKALRTVDGIQVENPWMLEYAQNINSGRQVDLRYAPPGVDATIFFPKTLRETDKDPYILCVARLSDPRKNVGMLLEAYASMPTDLIFKVRLVLAGSSGPSKQFWKRVDELGLRERVSFIEKPQLSELVSIYQNASVFALPSDEEGLGVVLLEAMACAVPVVATRCGGPDGIITDGVDGFLVPLSDHKAMSACLTKLLLDVGLNKEIGVNGFKNMSQRYEQQVAGAQFVDMWENALSLKTRLTDAY